ncbi:fumarylacetoacetate hydrolase family protein [Paraburkholderia nemoris]|uniref:fumarylacetoacetate hydrolase family protein n=1 Tax=Paraburkholderia nemoris TaxID=2793076 RepID=UPI0038B96879
MEDNFFALATYSEKGKPAFAAIVIGEYAFELEVAHRAYKNSGLREKGTLTATRSVQELLEEWDRNFEVLQCIAEFVHREGPSSDRFQGGAFLQKDLRPLPPIARPSKILNCAANYGGHLAEMRKYTQAAGALDPAKVYSGDKTNSEPYLFLKAPSSLIGAHDDIVMPSVSSHVDWEAELGVVMGAVCRTVKAEAAMKDVAGFMTFNDVSCRDRLFRTDRPNFRTDWLSSKSYDSFGPSGPFLVPRAFVPNHSALRLTLKVNGETKQDGLAGEMIYSPEEQIEYASRMMSLLPGDIFATGTLAGVGQGTGVFLKPGDLVETEVHLLGRQRNRVVASETEVR